MKYYTEEEVINLLNKAFLDTRKALELGVFFTRELALPSWIEHNIVNPPPTDTSLLKAGDYVLHKTDDTINEQLVQEPGKTYKKLSDNVFEEIDPHEHFSDQIEQ